MLGRERRFRNASGVEREAEQAGLDRRAANPLGDGVRAGGGRGVPQAALGLRCTPEPQQPRQRADDNLADGMLEVSAGPCEQLERRRIEQRFRVDDLAHALETPRLDGVRGNDADYHTDGGRAPERHPDAHARSHRRCRLRAWGQVVERVPDWHRHRDLEDRLGRRRRPDGARAHAHPCLVNVHRFPVKPSIVGLRPTAGETPALPGNDTPREAGAEVPAPLRFKPSGPLARGHGSDPWERRHLARLNNVGHRPTPHPVRKFHRFTAAPQPAPPPPRASRAASPAHPRG